MLMLFELLSDICVSSLAKLVLNMSLLMCWNGCMRSFCCDGVFVMKMMFSMNVVNTKVVGKLHILVVLKSNDFRPISLGVMLFKNTL